LEVSQTTADNMGTKTKRKRQLDSVRSISFEARYDSKLIDPDDGNTNALSAHHEADAHMQTGYEGSMQEEMDFMSESLLPLPSFLERLVSCARAPTKKLRNPVYNGDSERSGERWIKEQKELRELAKTNHKITEYMPRKNAIDEIESHDNSKEAIPNHYGYLRAEDCGFRNIDSFISDFNSCTLPLNPPTVEIDD
jgi:hypothetical protein